MKEPVDDTDSKIQKKVSFTVEEVTEDLRAKIRGMNSVGQLLNDKLVVASADRDLAQKAQAPDIDLAFTAKDQASNRELELWHQRLNHLGEDNLRLLQRQKLVMGLPEEEFRGSVKEAAKLALKAK